MIAQFTSEYRFQTMRVRGQYQHTRQVSRQRAPLAVVGQELLLKRHLIRNRSQGRAFAQRRKEV
jgi:hypothetical protein